MPLNTPDYSSFILKIRQAKPDVVLGGLSAGDLSTFLKQWNELGMRGKIPFAEIAIGDTDIWSVGPRGRDRHLHLALVVRTIRTTRRTRRRSPRPI